MANKGGLWLNIVKKKYFFIAVFSAAHPLRLLTLKIHFESKPRLAIALPIMSIDHPYFLLGQQIGEESICTMFTCSSL